MRIEHTCNRNLAYVAPLSQTPLTWLHTNTHDGTAVQRYVCLSISINYIVKVPFVSFLKPLSRLKPADLFFSFDFTVCFFGLALVPSSQIFSRRIAPLYIYICLHILWFREPVLSGPPPTKARAKIKKKWYIMRNSLRRVPNDVAKYTLWDYLLDFMYRHWDRLKHWQPYALLLL